MASKPFYPIDPPHPVDDAPTPAQPDADAPAVSADIAAPGTDAPTEAPADMAPAAEPTADPAPSAIANGARANPAPDPGASQTPAASSQRSVRGGLMSMRVFSRAMQDLTVLTGDKRAATYEEVNEYVGHAIRIEQMLERMAIAEMQQQADRHAPRPTDTAQLDAHTNGSQSAISTPPVTQQWDATAGLQSQDISAHVEPKHLGEVPIQPEPEGNWALDGGRIRPAAYLVSSEEAPGDMMDASGGDPQAPENPGHQQTRNQWDQTDLVPIPGYSETGRGAYRSSNDQIIIEEVNRFNAEHGFKPGDSGYLLATTIKAMVMQESGGIGSPKAFNSDPMTVNNPPDWVDAKKIAGLTDAHQQMTPRISIRAGIAWAYAKGFTHDGAGKPTWRGWRRAITMYNGRSDLVDQNGRRTSKGVTMFRDYYANKILSNADQAQAQINARVKLPWAQPSSGWHAPMMPEPTPFSSAPNNPYPTWPRTPLPGKSKRTI